MKNMWEELWHNLKSGVFVNLILIVLFTLFFWQGTAISSYFVDIPIGSSGSRQADGLYYQLSYYYMSDNSREENAILKQLDDPDSIPGLDRIYRELHEELGEKYFNINYADLKLDYEELSQRFEDSELLDFLGQSEYPGYYDPSETELLDVMPTYAIGNIASVFSGQGLRMDENAMERFGLKASEGSLFRKEDFVFQKGQEEIPVLLGNAFSGKYHPGETLNGYLFGEFQLRIVGILEENTTVLTERLQNYETNEPEQLDHSVIAPYFYMGAPGTAEEQTFAINNYQEGINGTIVLPLDASRSEINRTAKQVSSIFNQNGLQPQMITGPSYGVVLFQQESEQTMRIFLGASAVMAVLAISGICMSMIAKLNRNLQRYGIEMMNGQSTGTILAAFLLEMALVIGAGLLLTVWQFMTLIRNYTGFFLVTLALAGFSAAVVSLVFIRKLRAVDIEEIIRREE